MLTTSPSHSPILHSSSSSPATFHARSYTNGALKTSPSQSPRRRPRQNPVTTTTTANTSYCTSTPRSVAAPSSSLRALAVSQPTAAPRKTADAGTQYSPRPPAPQSAGPDPALSTLTFPQGPPDPAPHSSHTAPPGRPAKVSEALNSPLPKREPGSPQLDPRSPSKRGHGAETSAEAQEQDQAMSRESTSASLSKRPRPQQPAVKAMPARYELCDVKDLVVLISDMLMELVRYNDDIPLKDGRLTRFHSRAPPTISIPDYLSRLTTHATLSPPLLLSMVYYIDRLCALYPAFVISSLTVHRFLITAATVASKGLSDSFWTNGTYARVGGVSLRELALLELELLGKIQWRIVPRPEVLGDYYQSLVERSDAYCIDGSDVQSEQDRGAPGRGTQDVTRSSSVGASQSRGEGQEEDTEMGVPPASTTQGMSSSSDGSGSSRTRLTVLISGNGTNLQALITATQSTLLSSCTIVRVISNRKAAYGLERATDAGIPTTYHNLLTYKNQRPKSSEGVQLAREAYDADLASLVLADRPDLVVCAGFMHVLSPRFLESLAAVSVPVINLHPALPGKFDGMNAIERAYEAFLNGEETVTGAMVHYVIAEVDRGEVILAQEVEMQPGEGLEGLTTRIHEVEWQIIVKGTEIAVTRLLESRKTQT